jgi:hypothetical protein
MVRTPALRTRRFEPASPSSTTTNRVASHGASRRNTRGRYRSGDRNRSHKTDSLVATSNDPIRHKCNELVLHLPKRLQSARSA